MTIAIGVTVTVRECILTAKLSLIPYGTVTGTVYVAVRVTVKVILKVTVTATAYAMLWMGFAYVLVL